MIPKSREEAAAVVVACLLQAGLILSIATPAGVQAWAAFSVAILGAAIAPAEVFKRVRVKLAKKE